MAFAGASSSKDRLTSLVAVIVLHAVAGFCLLNAFGVSADDIMRSEVSNLNVVFLALPPPIAADRPDVAAPEPKGVASAANLKKTSAPREAPKRIVKVPPMVVQPAAPKAGKGRENDAGAANTPGAGSGAGGFGSGFGSGNSGAGTGGGGVAARAQQISGRITNADYPPSARAARQGGTVTTYFNVDTDGRVSKCRVIESSGNADIDAITCRLIEQRFRFEPARNKAGQPIADVTGWQQAWWLERGKRKIIRPEDDLPKRLPIYVPPPESK